MKFRPCIDLKNGKVVQIVGGSLRDSSSFDSSSFDSSSFNASLRDSSLPESSVSDIHYKNGDASQDHKRIDSTITNFESANDSSFYANLYKNDGLFGGHVISLGNGNHNAVVSALNAFPQGLQFGGGITPENAAVYLDAGASHVIVTSFVFSDGNIDMDKLKLLEKKVGKNNLVLDLSCRKKEGNFWIVTDRWQKFTSVTVNERTLEHFAAYCSEFLVHGVDVEGKMGGVQSELVELLGNFSPIPVTYAGGVKSFSELEFVKQVGLNRVDLTIGSALDLFGGNIPYKEVVKWHYTNQ